MNLTVDGVVISYARLQYLIAAPAVPTEISFWIQPRPTNPRGSSMKTTAKRDKVY